MSNTVVADGDSFIRSHLVVALPRCQDFVTVSDVVEDIRVTSGSAVGPPSKVGIDRSRHWSPRNLSYFGESRN